MPQIQLRDANLYYEEEGSGDETIVFGHSLLLNLRMFDYQVEHLKGRFRCVRFDFRGQGKSEHTRDGYDLETLTEDAAELIEKLECGPCHFVGFSMGGMVGLRLALKHPNLIKSLILIDTSSEPEPKAADLRNWGMLLVANTVGLWPLGSKLMSMFFGRSFLRDTERKAERKVWKNHFLSNKKPGIIRAVKGVLGRTEVTSTLPMIKAPTVIMVGEEDELTDISKSKIIHEGISGSRLEVIPRASHLAPLEEPAIVNRIIDEFLQNVSR